MAGPIHNLLEDSRSSMHVRRSSCTPHHRLPRSARTVIRAAAVIHHSPVQPTVLGDWLTDCSHQFHVWPQKHHIINVLWPLVASHQETTSSWALFFCSSRVITQRGEGGHPPLIIKSFQLRRERPPAACCPACRWGIAFKCFPLSQTSQTRGLYYRRAGNELDLSWPPLSPKEDLEEEQLFSQRIASTCRTHPFFQKVPPVQGRFLLQSCSLSANIPDWLSHRLSGDIIKAELDAGFVSIWSVNPDGRLWEKRSDGRVLGTGRGGVADGRKS